MISSELRLSGCSSRLQPRETDKPHALAARRQPRALDSWCRRAHASALVCARRRGLNSDECDDCAMEFIAKFLAGDREQGILASDACQSAAWVYRCASNHAVDYLRRRIRISSRERDELVSPVNEGESAVCVEPADDGPGPERLLLRSACLEQIGAAIDELSSVQRELFVRHHTKGESIFSLAAAMGRTPHAVEQALLRARRRLRTTLERKGWGESDVRDHLISSGARRNLMG